MTVTHSESTDDAVDVGTGAWVRRDDVLTSDVADRQAVMLDVQGGTYFGVASTAYHLWSMLEAPQSAGDLVDGLAAAHPDVAVERLRDDVLEFLSDLVSSGLVRRPA